MSNFKLKYLDSLLESDYIISPQKVVNDLWGSNAQDKREFSYDAQEEKRRKSMSNAQERMEFSSKKLCYFSQRELVKCPREDGVFFVRKISSN